MKFPCIECGLCCRLSGKVPQLAGWKDSSGRCRYFDEMTNHCRIYSRRPDICNVSAMYKLYFQNTMTEKEFYRKNLEVCLRLNQEAGQQENCRLLRQLIEQIR